MPVNGNQAIGENQVTLAAASCGIASRQDRNATNSFACQRLSSAFSASKHLGPAKSSSCQASRERGSVEQLERLLPAPPIVVGFGVDDALIFSAPAFNALEYVFHIR